MNADDTTQTQEPEHQDEKWWKKAVVYQIYPRSFQDSNHDGVGDIPGIIQRLDYLKELGIDAIWLSPVCRSPQDDNGYDISDYKDIDPLFGTLSDMELLISEAEKRGIAIILDLVLNHSSDEHPWFIEAKKSRDNPYHDYYLWHDGTGSTPPNDLTSVFGGSAWEWVPELKQYYFHQFSKKQPDLNWDNPTVRNKLFEIIRWWMDKGVRGFRLDVIDRIAKEPNKGITKNGPRLQQYIRELTANTFSHGDLIVVGETPAATVELAKLYSAPDGSEFSMVFQFEHMRLDQQKGNNKTKWDLAPLDLVKLKKSFSSWQQGLHNKGWNSLYWNNHDQPRIVSRWGDDGEYRETSAKMLAVVLHGMQGTPYIYQGEELGMTNVRYAFSEYRDIELVNFYKERKALGYPEAKIMESIHAKARDNARTPMQWNDKKYAGFSDVKPWIKVNPNYTKINAEAALSNPDSIFYFYKKLIALRKKFPVFYTGNFRLFYEEDAELFVYERRDGDEALLVVANFSDNTVRFSFPEKWSKKDRMLIHNYESPVQEKLHPYEAVVYYKGKN